MQASKARCTFRSCRRSVLAQLAVVCALALAGFTLVWTQPRMSEKAATPSWLVWAGAISL